MQPSTITPFLANQVIAEHAAAARAHRATRSGGAGPFRRLRLRLRRRRALALARGRIASPFAH